MLLGKKIFNWYTLASLILGVLLTLGLFASLNNNEDDTQAQIIRDHNSNYKFIKPVLYTEYDDPDYGKKLFEFEKRIHDEVNGIISQKPETTTSFYFKDLTNPSWVAINQEEKYTPASMIKVPRLIAYYKLKESEPDLFNTTLQFTGDDLNDLKSLGPKGNIAPNGVYTIGELLQEMIINSDNNAYEMLRRYRPGSMKKIFEDLDTPFIDDPIERSKEDFVTVDKMSKFFLVLYNATYLSKESSEQALELLSKTSFNDGVKIETDKPFPISHKFGEKRVFTETSIIKEAQFHDCGIFYYPAKPYIMCVMTKGKSIEDQVQTTQEISQKVFDIVSENYK